MAALQRFNKIKGLAVFADFGWQKDLTDFRRYNLVYGWNGSGKTVLSKLFDSLSMGAHVSFPGLEYECTFGDGKFTHNEKSTTSIRVFNEDYVARVVGTLNGYAEPIFVVSEQSQAILSQVDKDRRDLDGIAGDATKPGKRELLRRARQNKSQLEGKVEAAFTNIARTISAAWGVSGASRTYRRPNAQTAFEQLKGKSALSKEQLEHYTETLSQSAEPKVSKIASPIVPTKLKPEALGAWLEGATQRASKALEQAAQNVAIERLKSDPLLARWVETGLEIHRERTLSSCEFCGNELPTARLDALSAHFSEADKLLKSELDEIHSILATAKSIVVGIVPPDEARLYKQLRPAYMQATGSLVSATDALSHALDAISNEVFEKKSKTMETVKVSSSLDATKLLNAIDQINEILGKHNDFCENLQVNQTTAQSQIESYHLSTVYDDVVSFRSEIATLAQTIEHLEAGDPGQEGDLGISALEARIAQNMAKISSAHKSCETLNASLRDYFGRDELYFVVKNDAKGQPLGYVLRRQNDIAKNISEGERTAIAFAHFCIYLHSKDFSLKSGIVVIDDPISSLDSALLFRVCAAIKRQTNGATQLFVLTHNMEFFNQVKNWFRNDPSISGEDEENPNYRLLMIDNRFDAANTRRVATIIDIDPLLRDYESEYHYLFKKLHSFDTEWPPEGNLPLRAIYDYPNLARKLLECFLAFRVPTRGSMYVRLLGLKKVNPDISSETVESVYSFVNSHSHLDTKTGLLEFDATLGVSGRDAISRTLSLIEKADSLHYKAMVQAIAKK